MAHKDQLAFSTSSHSTSNRIPNSRSHVHSSSMGSISHAGRVNRRKSSSSHAATASVVAAVNIALGNNGYASTPKRLGKPHSKSPFPQSLPATSGFDHSIFDSANSIAIADSPPMSIPEDENNESINSKRVRRASEGSRKPDGRDNGKGDNRKGSPGDLKCDKCGKGYKHSSCLSKHLWEHRPEWQITSKLLISKHQQVQLLEAAQVLMQMQTEQSSAESETAVDSDVSSPHASGSETQIDRGSSSEHSPPPDVRPGHSPRADSKRFSSNSSVYSQSYQSSIFSDMGAPSNVSRSYMSHFRQWSNGDAARPTTSGTSVAESYSENDERANDLAAAVNLLSCSVPSVMLPADAPPVPPLPKEYLGQKADHLSGSTIRGPESYVRERHTPSYATAEDVEMVDDEEYSASENEGAGRSEEDEEGMFGKMEE